MWYIVVRKNFTSTYLGFWSNRTSYLKQLIEKYGKENVIKYKQISGNGKHY